MKEYRSERITNISELEAILEKISILSQLVENSSDIEEIKGITKSIKESAQKARDFEFHIEVRVIHDANAISIGQIALEDIERITNNEKE